MRRILKEAPLPNGTGEKVLLVHVGGGRRNQFVTWRADPDGNTFWGHYFEDILAAAKDFEDRCNSCGAVPLN